MRELLETREIQAEDVGLVADYWLTAEPDFLISMGVDLDKLPGRDQLIQMLQEQLSQPYHKKQSYCIIWQVNGKPAGHSNINKIKYGEEAYMHLHLWKSESRKQGIGTELVKMSLPYFFEKMKLNNLFCEPYAFNPAPNKALVKVGFEFEKKYVTVPGSLNFEQEVNRWKLTKEKFEKITLSKKAK